MIRRKNQTTEESVSQESNGTNQQNSANPPPDFRERLTDIIIVIIMMVITLSFNAFLLKNRGAAKDLVQSIQKGIRGESRVFCGDCIFTKYGMNVKCSERAEFHMYRRRYGVCIISIIMRVITLLLF